MAVYTDSGALVIGALLFGVYIRTPDLRSCYGAYRRTNSTGNNLDSICRLAIGQKSRWFSWTTKGKLKLLSSRIAEITNSPNTEIGGGLTAAIVDFMVRDKGLRCDS